MGCVIYDPNWPNNTPGTGNPPDPIYDDPVNFYADYFFLRTDANSLSKLGYKISGWSWDPTATTPEYPINSQHYGEYLGPDDHTIYAVWIPHPSTYTVTYNGNGNTGGTTPTDLNNPYAYNATIVVPGQGTLTKTSNVFLGWSTNPNATDEQYVSNSTFLIVDNVVLYAVWAPPRTLIYDGNGTPSGSPPVDFSSPYLHGSTVTLLGQGSLWFNGWFFAGWSTDPFAAWPTNVYDSGSQFVIVEDTVLYAIWVYGGPPVGNQYQVFYNGNGSTGGSPPVDYNVYQGGGVVTVLGQGSLLKSGHVFLGWSINPSATSATYVQGSTFSIPANSVTLHAVWGSGGGSGGSTIVVPYNGCEAGSNSKQTTRTYNGASTIMQVATNLPNNTDENAIIENLIIDGLNLSNNVTGILLENVCNCLIRNVTIMNCEVGIKIKLTGSNGNFSRNNRFEHIRMINVKTGILFEGTSSAKDFSYTTIEDVGISLVGNSTDTGIKIGNDNVYANLYGAFVKVNVWLNESGGKGLEVNGQIKGGLVNLAVAENGNNSGRCIVLNTNAVISNNQSFLLTSLGVANNIVNNGGSYSGIKIVT